LDRRRKGLCLPQIECLQVQVHSSDHLISVLLSGYRDEGGFFSALFDKFDPDDQSSRPKIRCPPRFSVFSALRLSGKPHTARLTLLRFFVPLYPTYTAWGFSLSVFYFVDAIPDASGPLPKLLTRWASQFW